MSMADWRLQPLRTFWQGVNWENQVLAPVIVNNQNGSYPALSLLMPVRQYFRAIAWNGVPEIAAISYDSTPSVNTIDDNSVTVEDFLDDISKFF